MEGITPRARERIFQETGNEIVADWYLDVVLYFIEHLENYNTEEGETMENILAGFDEAIENLSELNGGEELTPHMDDAYHIFLEVIIRIPCLLSIPKYILALTLARFFVEKFYYLPPPPEIYLWDLSDRSSDSESISSWEALEGQSISSDSGLATQDDS